MKIRATIVVEYEARPSDYGLETITLENVQAIDTVDAVIESLGYGEGVVKFTLEEVND